MSTSAILMSITLCQTSLVAGSVALQGLAHGLISDDGKGHMVDAAGKLIGEIDYQTGTLSFPDEVRDLFEVQF